MTLPATLAEARRLQLEADAVAFARQFVRQIRDEKIVWCGVPLSWFDKYDNRRAAMALMKKAAMDAPLAMIDLVKFARAGFDLADDAARELILEYKHRCIDLPPPLDTFNMELVDPRHRRHKPQGKKKADHFMRNIAITMIVAEVCWKFGLKPTRGTGRRKASKHEWPSGCNITAQAMREESHFAPDLGLAIEEDAVAAVWRQYGRMALIAQAARTKRIRSLSVVPDVQRRRNIKKFPLISHKAAANRTDALKVLAA